MSVNKIEGAFLQQYANAVSETGSHDVHINQVLSDLLSRDFWYSFNSFFCFSLVFIASIFLVVRLAKNDHVEFAGVTCWITLISFLVAICSYNWIVIWAWPSSYLIDLALNTKVV